MSFLSAIFAPGEQARSDDLDRQRAELEQKRAERGLITPDQAQANIAAIQGQRIDVATDLNDAFIEGAKEGYDAETNAIKKTVAAPFNFLWDSLPWQLMVVAAAALFIYMGGWVWLKGRLAR